MSQLVAYKGKQTIKDKYVKRVKDHYDMDEIIKGTYWENGKGCAVGCTMEISQGGTVHEAMEKKLGVPKELAYLEDTIFEELSNGEAKKFPLRFLEAITPGTDLSLITAKFMVWQFEDKKYGLKNIKEVKTDKEVYGFCEEVVALYKRKIAGDEPSEDEFYDLYLKIDRAWAGAWAGAGAWARAWAGAGARAWARARARAGARAWAGAWAGADYDKAYAHYTKVMADKLISLLKEAK